MATAFAPGKCILFGEHAVVYGHPAVAVAIDAGVEVKLETSDKWEIKNDHYSCLLYTSPSPRDQRGSRMPSSA